MGNESQFNTDSPFDLQDSLSLIITIVTLNACHTSDFFFLFD